MQQVPFPHILSSSIELSNKNLRVVTDQPVKNIIIEPDHRQMNQKTGNIEMVYNIYQFDEIKEQRKARGDWTNWPKHPTYYAGRGGLIQRDFESNLTNYIH